MYINTVNWTTCSWLHLMWVVVTTAAVSRRFIECSKKYVACVWRLEVFFTHQRSLPNINVLLWELNAALSPGQTQVVYQFYFGRQLWWYLLWRLRFNLRQFDSVDLKSRVNIKKRRQFNSLGLNIMKYLVFYTYSLLSISPKLIYLHCNIANVSTLKWKFLFFLQTCSLWLLNI